MEDYDNNVKFGIFESYSHYFGPHSIGCTFPINKAELISITMKEMILFEGEEIKARAKYNFCCGCYIPEVTLIVAHTYRGSELFAMQVNDLEHPILANFPTEQIGVYHMIYSAKSRVILTIGTGVKVWNISWVDLGRKMLTTDSKVIISHRATFAQTYDSPMLNPPSFDYETELIYLPTFEGIRAFSLDGTPKHFASRLPADNNTIFSFCQHNRKLITSDPVNGVCIWKKSGEIEKRISMLGPTILSIAFVDPQNFLYLNASGSLFLINAKASRPFHCYDSMQMPTRLNVIQLYNRPHITFCVGSVFRLLRVVVPWKVWNLNISRPSKISRCPKFDCAARIITQTSNSFIKLYSPKTRRPLLSTTPSEATTQRFFFYDRGTFVEQKFDKFSLCFIEKAIQTDESRQRDNLLVSFDTGFVIAYDMSRVPCVELWSSKMNALCIEMVKLPNLDGKWSYAIGRSDGGLSFLDYFTFDELRTVSVCKEKISGMLYHFASDCIVFVLENKLKLFDLKTYQIIDSATFKFTEVFAIHGDVIYLGGFNGEIERFEIVNRRLFSAKSDIEGKPHDERITSFSFGRKYYLSSSIDSTFMVWNYEHEKMTLVTVPFPIYSISFLGPKRQILLGMETEIMVMDPTVIFGEEVDPEIEIIDNYDRKDDSLDPVLLAIEAMKEEERRKKLLNPEIEIHENKRPRNSIRNALLKYQQEQEKLQEKGKMLFEKESGAIEATSEDKKKQLGQMNNFLNQPNQQSSTQQNNQPKEQTNQPQDKEKENGKEKPEESKNGPKRVKRKKIRKNDNEPNNKPIVEPEKSPEKSYVDDMKPPAAKKNAEEESKENEKPKIDKKKEMTEKPKIQQRQRPSRQAEDDKKAKAKEGDDDEYSGYEDDDYDEDDDENGGKRKKKSKSKSPTKQKSAKQNPAAQEKPQKAKETKKAAPKQKENSDNLSPNKKSEKVSNKQLESALQQKKPAAESQQKNPASTARQKSPVAQKVTAGQPNSKDNKNSDAKSGKNNSKSPESINNNKNLDSKNNGKNLDNKNNDKNLDGKDNSQNLDNKNNSKNLDNKNGDKNLDNKNNSKNIDNKNNGKNLNAKDDGKNLDDKDNSKNSLNNKGKNGKANNNNNGGVDEIVDKPPNPAIVDSNGNVLTNLGINSEGKPVNGEGDVLDGLYVNKDGNFVNKDGQYVNAKGEPTDSTGKVKYASIASQYDYVDENGESIPSAEIEKEVQKDMEIAAETLNVDQDRVKDQIKDFHDAYSIDKENKPIDEPNQPFNNSSELNKESDSNKPVKMLESKSRQDEIERPSTPPPVRWSNEGGNNAKEAFEFAPTISIRKRRSRTPPMKRRKRFEPDDSYKLPPPNIVLDPEAVLAMFGRGHTEMLPLVERIRRDYISYQVHIAPLPIVVKQGKTFRILRPTFDASGKNPKFLLFPENDYKKEPLYSNFNTTSYYNNDYIDLNKSMKIFKPKVYKAVKSPKVEDDQIGIENADKENPVQINIPIVSLDPIDTSRIAQNDSPSKSAEPNRQSISSKSDDPNGRRAVAFGPKPPSDRSLLSYSPRRRMESQRGFQIKSLNTTAKSDTENRPDEQNFSAVRQPHSARRQRSPLDDLFPSKERYRSHNLTSENELDDEERKEIRNELKSADEERKETENVLNMDEEEKKENENCSKSLVPTEIRSATIKDYTFLLDPDSTMSSINKLPDSLRNLFPMTTKGPQNSFNNKSPFKGGGYFVGRNNGVAGISPADLAKSYSMKLTRPSVKRKNTPNQLRIHSPTLNKLNIQAANEV